MEVSASLSAREQPGSRAMDFDITADRFERRVREQGVAILPMLRLSDMDEFPLEFEVFTPQPYDFTNT